MESSTMKRHTRQILDLHGLSDMHYIYNNPGLKKHLNDTIFTSLSYPEYFLEELEFLNKQNIKLSFNQKRLSKMVKVEYPILINNKPYSPFDSMNNETIRELLHFAESFQFNLTYKINFTYFNRESLCLIIDNTYFYDLSTRGIIYFTILQDITYCPKENEAVIIENDEVLPVFILFFGVIELVFVVSKIFYMMKIYFQITSNPHYSKKIQELEAEDKMRFFNLWLFMFLVTDFFLIYGK